MKDVQGERSRKWKAEALVFKVITPYNEVIVMEKKMQHGTGVCDSIGLGLYEVGFVSRITLDPIYPHLCSDYVILF